MTISEDRDILSNLSLALKQKTEKYTIISTFSTKRCIPVIYKPKHEKPILTTKTTHFCLLFTPEKTPILALEVFTYLIFYKDHIEKLVYVSKADTTGLDAERSTCIGSFVSEYLHSICELSIETLLERLSIKREDVIQKGDDELDGIFLSKTQYLLNLLERKASGKTACNLNENHINYTVHQYLKDLGINSKILEKGDIHVKLVLFTRSEGQYLFPESMKNSNKHILDGNQLLKWWLKNVDNITSNWNTCERYLNILNFDEREINRYFTGLSHPWKTGNVYDSDPEKQNIALYKIPLLPDDPKGRFIEHLIVEGRAKKVDSKRYWQELAVRQEFSFGAVVGLIGVEGVLKQRTDDIFQSLYPSELKRLVELVTTKDYSDESDWGQLFDEVQGLTYLKLFHTFGKLTNDQKRKSETNQCNKVNTLLCVRKKVKK